MRELVTLLKTVIDRIPWPTEETHQAALDLLRKVEAAFGLTESTLGPPAGQTEPGAAPPTPTSPPEPTPTDDAVEQAKKILAAQGWTPPPSPEVNEPGNVFAGTGGTAGDAGT